MEVDLESKYLKELSEGSHKAFDILFTKYHPIVINFLIGFVKDGEIANDMAQEIFFKIWLNRQTISQVESLKHYLFRMARNMVYDYYDHSLIKAKYEAKSKDANQSFYTDMIEEKIFAQELSLLVELAVEKMPDQRRKIFRMSRKEGISNEEIAKTFNISKRTVENHITLALKQLRNIIMSAVCFFI